MHRLANPGRVELRLVDDQAGHAGAAAAARDLHAIDIDLEDPRHGSDHPGDLGGGDILALPAEGVPDPVHEIQIAEPVGAHQVPRPEPGIPGLEHVAENLALGRTGVGIALEPHLGLGRVDPGDGFTDLALDTGDTAAGGFPDRTLRDRVEPDQGHIDGPLHIGRNPTDRMGPAIEVEQGEIALGRAVEFQDPGDGEPRLEPVPDVRPQPVADDQPEPVPTFVRMVRRIEQIAAELADILEQGGVEADTVAPEGAGRELAAQGDGPAHRQRDAGRTDPADRVIERQGRIDHIARCRSGGRGKGMHGQQHAQVGDPRSLRQAGRAAGIDQQDQVLGPDAGAPLSVGARGRGLQQQRVERGEILGHPTGQPGGRRRPQMGPGRPPGLRQRGVDDDMIGPGGVDTMGQPGPGQLGIDQGRRQSDLGHAEPDRQIVRPVLHEQGDRGTRLQPPVQRPGGIAVGPALEVGIGPALLLEQDRNPRGMTVDRRFEVIGEIDAGARFETGNPGQHAQSAPQEPNLAPERGKHAGQSLDPPMLTRVCPPRAKVSAPPRVAAIMASRSKGTLMPAWAAGRAAMAATQR